MTLPSSLLARTDRWTACGMQEKFIQAERISNRCPVVIVICASNRCPVVLCEAQIQVDPSHKLNQRTSRSSKILQPDHLQQDPI